MLPSVIAAFILISCTSGQNPAVQVILTDKGLQYGRHVGAGWIQEKLERVTIPKISGEIPLSIFGSIHYQLTGLTITKCDFPEPSVKFYQDVTGFNTSLPGLSVALTGEWMIKFGLIHTRGSMDMAIFNLDLTSVVELGKDANGHLSVTSTHCDAPIEDLDFKLHDGGSWILQPIVDHFKLNIISAIEKQICLGVEKQISVLEHHLQAMPVSFEVNKDLTLDLPLTVLPVMEASFVNLGLKGEFYSRKTHKDPPFESRAFTMPEQPNHMLSVGLSEFTVNSASFGYFSAGLLQVLINDSMIPPTSPIHLNTSAMGPFIPELPKMFPNLMMDLQAYAREAPLFSFQSGVVKLAFPGAVKAFAIQPNATQTPLFKLNVDSAYSGKMWIAGERLKGSVTMDNFTLTLVSSEVGPIKTDALGNIAKMVMKMVVLSKLNEKLDKGFALLRMLVNPNLMVEEGFISISSDAEVFIGFN